MHSMTYVLSLTTTRPRRDAVIAQRGIRPSGSFSQDGATVAGRRVGLG